MSRNYNDETTVEERPLKRACRPETNKDALDLASVLKIMVGNDVIEAKDLAAIGSTSTAMRSLSLEDDLWSCLCKRLFPVINSIPEAIIKRRGHRFLFRKLHASRESREDIVDDIRDVERPLQSPLLTCNDLSLLIYIHCRGKLAIEKSITGAALAELLQTGLLSLDMEEKLELGDFVPTIYSDFESDDDHVWYDVAADCSSFFQASMYLLHLERLDMCCVHQSSFAFHREEVTVKLDRDFSATISTIAFYDGGVNIAWKGSVTTLWDRIFKWFAVRSNPNMCLGLCGHSLGAVLPFLSFNISLLPRQACPVVKLADGTIHSSEKVEPVSKRIGVACDGFRVEIMLHPGLPILFEEGTYNSEEASEKHGVTVLHLLEHVAWSAETN